MKLVSVETPEQGGDVYDVIVGDIHLRIGRDEEDSSNARIIISDDEADDLFVIRVESETRVILKMARVTPNGEEYDEVEWNTNS